MSRTVYIVERPIAAEWQRVAEFSNWDDAYAYTQAHPECRVTEHADRVDMSLTAQLVRVHNALEACHRTAVREARPDVAAECVRAAPVISTLIGLAVRGESKRAS